MKIAVVGSGGREHCILWRLSRDMAQHSLYAVPGNGGTCNLAKNIQANLTDVSDLQKILRRLSPDLVVVGPEIPLAAGIADLLQRDDIPCFGPVAAAARLESSKTFAKQLMRMQGIPTAEFEIFDDFYKLEHYVRTTPYRNGWVVKADGLAGGKGAYVCSSLDDVLFHAHDLLVNGVLGESGCKVVLERKLDGREVSALFICDGERFSALPAAQDYKRVEDNDIGPNTGGMGSFCPATHLNNELRSEVEWRIVAPTIRALKETGTSYRGVLYVGLMLTDTGPQVIEFNCRFGDPETQVILPVWHGDFAATLLACCEGKLTGSSEKSTIQSCAAVCVVLAATGYPGVYQRNIALNDIPDTKNTVTFHAGTQRIPGQCFSTGGRVLNAVGFGSTLTEARASAYRLAERLHVPGLRFRRDIASE